MMNAVWLAYLYITLSFLAAAPIFRSISIHEFCSLVVFIIQEENSRLVRVSTQELT